MERTIDTSIQKVYVRALDSYEQNAVEQVLFPLLDGMLADNGIEKTTLVGKTVVLKPNLVAKREPDAGITTHPAFIEACGRYFVALGAKAVIADSPGGIYNLPAMEGIYTETGMRSASLASGAQLNKDMTSQDVRREEFSVHSFHLLTPLVEADLIVNLCRLKTHALCEISAAVKNLFGSIPGLMKAEQHARFPKRLDFADMLCDLCLVNAPQLNITDGVFGMEGNGPTGGTLKKVGVVLASANPFASDLAAAYIMGYAPEEVGTIVCAQKRSLCPQTIEELVIDGDALSRFRSRFRRPDANAGGLLKQLPTIFGGGLQHLLEPRPTVNKKRCIGCGACMRVCPMHTIEVTDKKAHIHADACIKCYCCQEFCPEKVIQVKHLLSWSHFKKK